MQIHNNHPLAEKSQHYPKKRPTTHRPGFALIATISVMVLLVMIALAMLSLSSIELRSSRISQSKEKARTNARMALMIAIGELQKHAGADQSITIPAGAITAQGFAGFDVHPSKKRIAIAFRTDQVSTDWKNSREDSFSGILASGNHQETTDLTSLEKSWQTPEGLVEMTSIHVPEDLKIRVPKVSIQSGQGRMAWVIEGENSKASMTVVAKADSDIEHLAPDRFNIQRVDPADPILQQLPDRDQLDDLKKIITRKSADIFIGQGGALAPYSDWITLDAMSVPINVRDGGLKKDLTVALGRDVSVAEMEAAIGERMYPPVKGVSNPANIGGPKWTQPRSYFQMPESNEVDVRPQTADQMGIYPVIAGFTELLGVSNTRRYNPPGEQPYLPVNYYNNKYVMAVYITPILKLWNPYNRKLKLTDYTVAVKNVNDQYLSDRHSDDSEIRWADTGTNSRFKSYLPKAMRFEHRYVIKNVAFEPGEVKVFTLQKNAFLDMQNGNYKPQGGATITERVDVLGEGYILAELKEGEFTGHALWDLMLTKKDLEDYDAGQLNYVSGRATGGTLVGGGGFGTDGGDIQIYDSVRSNKAFSVVPGDMVTWNIKLYKGEQKLQPGPNDTTEPLVTITNINMDGGEENGQPIMKINPNLREVNNPNDLPFFSPQLGYIDSIWARRLALRMGVNDGDLDPTLYNVTNHPTKKIKWLADFNPRSKTIGLHPYEFTKKDTALYPDGGQPVIQPTSPGGNGLGTPGNYMSGVVVNLATTDQGAFEESIGYSDIGGGERCVLFELPSTSEPERFFHSVGSLRQCNFWVENGNFNNLLANGVGEEDWASDNLRPAFPIGDSFPDPRIKLSNHAGRYSEMSMVDGNNTYDLMHSDTSWMMNDSLWDGYFFSAMKSERLSHNPRIRHYGTSDLSRKKEGITQNAANIMISGTFNVNSVSEEAWTAFLLSTLGAKVKGQSDKDQAPYTRMQTPIGDAATKDHAIDDFENYDGYRVISDLEAINLAKQIVEQVKKRGPFLSMSDFVNRSTMENAPDDYLIRGALQAAIDASTINQEFDTQRIEIGEVGSIYEPKSYSGSIAAGVPGYLLQGDIMASTGHLMTVRDDTFRIRAYGEALEGGKVVATAWCEAIVQRYPDYIGGEAAETAPDQLAANGVSKKFGRKYRIRTFRWLASGEMASTSK